jgi:hypothetical protein
MEKRGLTRGGIGQACLADLAIPSFKTKHTLPVARPQLRRIEEGVAMSLIAPRSFDTCGCNSAEIASGLMCADDALVPLAREGAITTGTVAALLGINQDSRE